MAKLCQADAAPWWLRDSMKDAECFESGGRLELETMGIQLCELCGLELWGTTGTLCGCYSCICECCVEEVSASSGCEYCRKGRLRRSCNRCKMVVKDGEWLTCPAADCPLRERLQENCCETCWASSLEGCSDTKGLVKITSATTGDFIKQLAVHEMDPVRTVAREMAKCFALPESSLVFMNQEHRMLSGCQQLSSIEQVLSGKRRACDTPKKLMIIEWLPGPLVVQKSGAHGSRRLSCGHLSCHLASGDCQACGAGRAPREDLSDRLSRARAFIRQASTHRL